jgi:sorting nexin-1/2
VETLDDDLGPLGPLGAAPPRVPEEQPALPQKEHRASRPSTATKVRGLGLDNEEDENGLPPGARVPPPVQAQTSSPQRQTQPSVSIEQAARPTFNISVGDPHKVGDLTSSHTVYQVRTKVGREGTASR